MRRQGNGSRSVVLQIEALETRLAPANISWTGGGADSNWSTAGNWDLNRAPVNADVVRLPSSFGSISSGTVTTNYDLSSSVVIGAIQFTSVGGNVQYVINGTTTLVVNGGGGNDITMNLAGATEVINANISITSNTLNLTFNQDNTLQIDGVISGTFALSLSGGAGDFGTAIFTNTNTYTGATTIGNRQTLIVTADGALGATSGNVTVNNGGTLGFQGGVNYTSAQAVSVRGTGNGRGALENRSGTNSFAGTITMTADSTIGITSGQLTLSGQITGGNRDLNVTGPGTLVVQNATSNYTGITSVESGTLRVEADVPSGSAGALGNATSAVLVGDTSGSNDAALVTGGAFTVGRNIIVQAGTSGTATLGGVSGNASNFSGTVSMGHELPAAQSGQRPRRPALASPRSRRRQATSLAAGDRQRLPAFLAKEALRRQQLRVACFPLDSDPSFTVVE